MRIYSAVLENNKKLLVRLVTAMIPMVILLSVLTQTVFAKNVYVINDGDTQTVHTSYASDPERVLTEAGFLLDDGDQYTTEAVDGVSEITVQRAQNITVRCGDNTYEVFSFGETVQSLLDRLEIPYGDEYQLDHDLTDVTSDGMEISVDHVVCNTETYTEEIPYRTAICYDDTMAAGERKTLMTGVNGQIERVANVRYVNSQEQDRTVVQETVVQKTVDEVIVEGTGKNLHGKGTKAPLIGDGVIVTTDGKILKFSKSDEFKATAYTHTDSGCNMTTATGTTVRTGTVAVDPKIIPYGTKMFIITTDGKYIYGDSVAEDCGGAIKGKRLDLYFATEQECLSFGVRDCTVYFLEE